MSLSKDARSTWDATLRKLTLFTVVKSSIFGALARRLSCDDENTIAARDAFRARFAISSFFSSRALRP